MFSGSWAKGWGVSTNKRCCGFCFCFWFGGNLGSLTLDLRVCGPSFPGGRGSHPPWGYISCWGGVPPFFLKLLVFGGDLGGGCSNFCFFQGSNFLAIDYGPPQVLLEPGPTIAGKKPLPAFPSFFFSFSSMFFRGCYKTRRGRVPPPPSHPKPNRLRGPTFSDN